MQRHLDTVHPMPPELMLTLDPTNLSVSESRLVNLLFQQTQKNRLNMAHKVFESNIPYRAVLPDPTRPGTQIPCQIQFTHKIVRRTKWNNAKTVKSYRYTVINNDSLGSGNFASVQSVACTLKPRKNGTLQRKSFKSRAIKTIRLDRYVRVSYKAMLQNEQAAARKMPGLSGKKMTIDKNKKMAYLVMNKAPQKELFTTLEEDVLHHYKKLSTAERIQLSYHLADAFSQMHNENIVHRDIKPENIHLGPHLRAHILDMGFAIEEGTCDHMRLGSPAWIAPEAFNLDNVSHRSRDNYALGLLYHVIWMGSPRESMSVEEISGCLAQGYEPARPPQVRHIVHHTGLPVGVAQFIVTSILKLKATAPEARLSSNEIERRFRSIEIDLQPPIMHKGINVLQLVNNIGFNIKQDLMKLSKENFNNSITKLNEIVLSQLTSIPDLLEVEMSIIMSCFVQAIGVNAFKELTSKAALIDKISQITEEYTMQINVYSKLLTSMHHMIRLLGNFSILHPELAVIKEHFDELCDDLISLSMKRDKEKRRSTFDEYVKITDKFAIEIADIRHNLFSRLRYPSVPLWSSYAQVLTRLLLIKEESGLALCGEVSDILIQHIDHQLTPEFIKQHKDNAITPDLAALNDIATTLETSNEELLPIQLTLSTRPLLVHGLFSPSIANRLKTTLKMGDLAEPIPNLKHTA